MLIIDNLGLAIKSSQRTYESVMSVWVEAMKAMDRLVSGTPLRMQRSPDVLAAWQIFPDISYLGGTTEFIHYKDPVVQGGGVLTIGMETTSPNMEGIVWTLPLAHFQYYGKPKIKKSNIGTSSVLVTFDRFIQVAIGSAISQWGITDQDFEVVAHLLKVLGRYRLKGWPERMSMEAK
jgi:hypothetical protein